MFLTTVAKAREALGFKVIAYVVMPEHIHLLILPPEGYDISKILHRIKQPSSRLILRRIAKTKPLLANRLKVALKEGREENRFWQQGGGCDRNVYKERTLRFMVNYIHNNPVRRGLCVNACDWKYSSAGAYEGLAVLLSVDEVEL